MPDTSPSHLGALAALLLAACAHGAPGRCPDASAGEVAHDCPWAAWSRALSTSADAAAGLQRAAPRLWRDLGRDAGQWARNALWADSRNFDEHAHATIVPPAILSALGRRAHLAGEGEVVHAGLTHTYGYLFSTLQTPFGFKRARWVDGEIERGLGFAPGLLGPTPAEGTLLANVTCVLGKIAIAPPPREVCAGAAAALAGWQPPERRARLEESAQTSRGNITLVTDWLAYDGTRGLFVYSVQEGTTTRIITAFSADVAAWNALVAPDRLGEQLITARWNAAVSGLGVAGVQGTRRLVDGAPRPVR